MTTTTDIAALTTALDTCPDDEVPELLGVLADALEDVEDELANVFRQAIPDCHSGGKYFWSERYPPEWEAKGWRGRNHIDTATCERLRDTGTAESVHRSPPSDCYRLVLGYPTRRSAYLALAAALMETQS